VSRLAGSRLGVATLLVFDLVLFAPLLVTGSVISSHDFVRAHHPWRMTDLGVLEAENRLLSDPAASGETTLVRFRGIPRAFAYNPWVSAGAMGPILLAQGYLSPFTLLPGMALPEAGIETGILFVKLQSRSSRCTRSSAAGASPTRRRPPAPPRGRSRPG
jgi:hypothetical protein